MDFRLGEVSGGRKGGGLGFKPLPKIIKSVILNTE